MKTKIKLINGVVKLFHAKDKKKDELINFKEVVVSGNNEAEIIINFKFERIRGSRESDIQKHLSENRIKLIIFEIVKDLGLKNQ